MAKEPMVKFLVRLPKDLLALLRKEAKASERTVTQLIRHLLSEGLKKGGR